MSSPRQSCSEMICVSSKLRARLTQRAADLGYAPRYFATCLAFGFSRFDGMSTLPPQAANASRSAASPEITKSKLILKEIAGLKI